MRDLVRSQVLADRAWDARKYITRPLGPSWSTKYHPVLAINDSYLAVGAGNTVFLYRFTPPANIHDSSPGVVFENMATFPRDPKKDISGLAFEENGRSLLISFVHGDLGRISIPKGRAGLRKRGVVIKPPSISYIRQGGPPIRSLSTSNFMALTMSSLGVASLYSLSSSSLESETDGEGTFTNPGWSGYLSLKTSSGYAILGTSSHTPLAKHSIYESHLSSTPDVTLSPWLEDNRQTVTSVYSITGADLNKSYSSISSSDQLVVAGWYHGSVTLHDLRCPSFHQNSIDILPSLRPVLKMEDPIKLSAIYSVSSAGPHVVAGAAQHSVLHLFDVRSPKAGWSVYLPQGRSNSSPVYSTILESSRVWAATESHALAVDFGTVNERTYPPVGEKELNGKRPIGWHAPCYEHRMFRQSA